ncbi:MAG: hypothetical protein JWP82_1067 [Humibacillus sp.]|nr:hypothetical protein [Humibacillus sp.]
MGLFDRRRRRPLPPAVRAAVPLSSGAKVLAWATDDRSSDYLVATTHRVALVGLDGDLRWARPWHEVEAATWQGESELLTVSWVDGSRPDSWHVTEPSMIQQTVRERVQASVVLADEFRTTGRRTVRVVVRQDLASGEILEQVIAGKGARVDDPAVVAEAAERLSRLRAEIGR